MSSIEFTQEWQADYHEGGDKVFVSFYRWAKAKALMDDPFYVGEIAHREWKPLTVAEATQLRDALNEALAEAEAEANA